MKKLLCVLLAALLLAAAVPVSSSADPVIQGTFRYMPAFEDCAEEYERGYEEGLTDTSAPAEFPVPVDSYHILSIVKNVSQILKNHYPQTNLALIFALDSYYTDGVPETPAAPEAPKKTALPYLIAGGAAALCAAAAWIFLAKRRKKHEKKAS